MRPTNLQFIETNSRKCFFSYQYNTKSFQIGYLGIGHSKISGGFHLRYPSSAPIYISKINATLEGQEAFTFVFHDDLQSTKNIFYSNTKCIYEASSLDKFDQITSLDLNFDFPLEDDLPPSYSSTSHEITPLSQDIVKYKIKITIFRKCNFLKLQGKKKTISTFCQIDRYSLPYTLKSNVPISPVSMHFESNKRKSNSILDLIHCEASLPSEYIDMNSITSVQLNLILPHPNIEIDEIYLVFKEYQNFNDVERGRSFDDSKKILEYKLLKEDIEIVEEEINRYSIEIKLDVPAFECVGRFQAYEGVRIMKCFKVKHSLKVKIKFENEGELVLRREIWLQRSLNEKKILKLRENNCID